MKGSIKFMIFNHRIAVAALVSLITVLLVSSAVLAHPPSGMELNYLGGEGVLEVTITHRVGNPSRHYIERVTVIKNGETVLERTYNQQEDRSTSVYQYQVEAGNGDTLKVEAGCNRFGTISESLTVEGVPVRGKVLIQAKLTTDTEVPQVAEETPPTAYGLAIASLDRENNVLHYAVTYTGLSGTPTMAHFHRGAKGETGPPVRTIFGQPEVEGAPTEPPEGNSGFLSGSWKADGNQPLNEELEEALLSGEIYINIHTELNPKGEIRAQLVQVE